MELRIRGDLEQITRMIPILEKMVRASFITWDNPQFVAPFQYGGHKQETALIKLTRSGNLVIEYMQSPSDPSPPPRLRTDEAPVTMRCGECLKDYPGVAWRYCPWCGVSLTNLNK